MDQFGQLWTIWLPGMFVFSDCDFLNFCFQEIEAQEGYQAWIIGVVEKGNRTARIIDKPRVIEVPARDRDGELW